MDNPTYRQTHFRWRNDDGNETSSGATWAAAEDAADFSLLVPSDGTTQIRLRLQFVEDLNASSGPSLAFDLYHSIDGGSWSILPNSGAVPVRYYDSQLIAGNGTTGPQLTDPGGKSWSSGEQVESQSEFQSVTIDGDNLFECEYAIEFVGAELAGISEIEFRFTQGGTDFANYDVTPDFDPNLAAFKLAAGSTLGQGSKLTAAPHRIRQAGGSTLGQASTVTAAPIRIRLSQGHISVGAFG